MQCPHCKTQNPSDSRYCSQCATPLPSSDETLLLPPELLEIPEEKFTVGHTFAGRYKILEKLGGGGMGVVYKAEDIRLKRLVAIKFLPPWLTSREQAKLRFIQEAQSASILDHQNICTIHEIDESEDGQMYIAMAYYEGETLKSKIERGPSNINQAIDIIIQVTEGLAKAHSSGIVHRDIKPANVIVTRDGMAKIVDFGLAKLSSQTRLTRTGTFMGTPLYMSPEQARGEDVNERSDLWSLGVVFYELLTGKLPYLGENDQVVLYSILNKSPVPPRELRNDIPEEAERIILKCLRKKKEERYSSATNLLQDLVKLKKSLDSIEEKEGAGKKKIPEEKKETERRQAAVMFAEILGYAEILESLDPEEAALVMNRCFGMLESVIRKYGGKIDKISGGILIALFGVPTAIEDAPKRSINAAIELRNSLVRFKQEENLKIPLDIHIGIEAGTVIAGAMDSGGYSVTGEAVNLALRLKDLSSKGQIYVGLQTYKYTQNEFEFEPLKPVSVKGWKNPVPVFQLLSLREKVYRARLGAERMIYSEMVGRDKELDKLELQVLKVINGEGSIVNVIGEAGIGKSRLIAELSQKDEIKKVTYLMGRALSIGKNLSFHPIIDILKSWARIKEEDSSVHTAQKLEKAIKEIDPEGISEVFPFIATLMGIKLAGKHAERVKGIEGEALEKLILKNLRELFVKIAEIRPLVVVFEDLHWADRTSVELLESLYRLAESNSILFINVFRPHYEETSERMLETIRNRYENYHTEIYLEPLDGNQCEVLIENLLNVRGFPTRIKELIIEKAEGNPFFIEEVARSFIDEGVVEMVDGNFRVTEKIHSVFIPETIHEILMARIDKLEEEIKSLLKIAAVIGRNFFYKILAVVAKSIGDIDDKLEFLKEVQLIKERRRLEELEYLFKHALVQEVVYESILLKKRKELHVEVAKAIELVFPERLHEFYGMLAFHYSSGENLEKAEEYLIKAGEEALKAAASSEAINYYQEALKLYLAKHGDSGDPDTIANLEWNIAKAFLNKGHMVEAVTHFDRVLELWGDRRPKSNIGALFYFIFNLLKVLQSLYLPTRKVKDIPSKRINNIFEATYQRGMALVSINTRRMVTDSIRFLGTIRKYDLNKVANGVPIYASSSALFFFSGISFRIARKLLDYAQSYIAPEDIKTHFTYKFWELSMDTLWGNWNVELRYDPEIVDRNIQDGDLFTAPGHVFWSGILVTEQGRFNETEIYIKKLHEIGEVYENDYARSRKYALNTRYLLESRNLVNILSEADEAISRLTKIGQKFWALYLIGLKAKAHLIMGNKVGAEKALKQGREIIGQEKQIAPFYISTFRISQFLFHIYDFEEALHSKDKSNLASYQKKAHKSGKESVRNSKKCAPSQTEAYKLMGVYYWLRGKQKKALSWWTRSIEVGKRLGARPELARTYLEVGKRLQEKLSPFHELNGVTAEENIKKAKLLFEEMNLSWDIEELEKIKNIQIFK